MRSSLWLSLSSAEKLSSSDSVLSISSWNFALALVICATGAFAQQAPPTSAVTASSTQAVASHVDAPEMTTETVPTTFKVRVNQVLLRVVVTDEQGRAVGNLNREDFNVLDKGKLQVITSFSRDQTNKKIEEEPRKNEISPETEIAERAPAFAERHIVYLFDDRHIRVADLMPIKLAFERQLENVLRPKDRIAILTTSETVKLDFTDDRAQIRAAVARIISHTTQYEETNCPYMSYYVADQILTYNNLSVFLQIKKELFECEPLGQIGCVAPQPPPQGNVPADVPDALKRVPCDDPREICKPGNWRVCQLAKASLWTGNKETSATIMMLSDTAGWLKSILGQRAIVLVSSGYHVSRDHQFDLERAIERATRSGVIVNTLDVRGVWTDPVFTAEMGVQASGINCHTETARGQGEVLGEIAEATGGIWFHGNNDMDLGVRRTSQAPEYTYLLAFSPQNLKPDGSFHKLKVTLKHPGRYTVVARRGYYAPRASADPKETARREIEEALFSQEESREIPISVHTEFFRTSNDAARVSVVSKIDLRPVVFRREEDRNRGQLTVVTGIFDRNGKFVFGEQKLIDLRLKDETFRERLRNGAVMKSSFDLKPGAYQVRVVVRDGEGQQLSASNAVIDVR